jgi:hypothetical protein
MAVTTTLLKESPCEITQHTKYTDTDKTLRPPSTDVAVGNLQVPNVKSATFAKAMLRHVGEPVNDFHPG